MIKTWLFSILVFAGYAVASEVAVSPFEFQQPMPKLSDQYYKEAIKMEKEGNPNVKFFLEKVRFGYHKQQTESKLNEPEDVFIGCLLYQYGGPQVLDTVNLAHTADVLAGHAKSDGSGEYTEQDAKKLVGSFNQEQGVLLAKLYQDLQYLAYSCYSYTHHGFIVMPTASPTNTQYVKD